MKQEEIKDKVIELGVKSLIEFGYPHANKETILSDWILRAFFKGVIEDSIGHNAEYDTVLNELLEDIKKLDSELKGLN